MMDIGKVNVVKLYAEKSSVNEKIDLTPQEIRLLSKLHKCTTDLTGVLGYFDEYHFDYKAVISKFFSGNLLELSSIRFELQTLAVPKLKELLRQKDEKARGNKTELIDKIISCYTEKELQELNLQQYLVLTQAGQELIKQNETLLLAYNGLMQNYVTAEEIVEEQKKNFGADVNDLLISLYRKHIQAAGETASFSERLSLFIDLQKLYRWKGDNNMVEQIQKNINKVNDGIDKEREENTQKAAGMLGIPLEELRRMEERVREEMGDEWEKELNAKNRKKAGIE